MSRVYTEKVIRDVAIGTAAYIASFQKALGSTRIRGTAPAGFGGTLLDFLLNVFDTSDPWTPEEVGITAAWSVSDGNQFYGTESQSGGEFENGPQLHLITAKFKAQWPPPSKWAQTVDWGPLTQTNPRHRHFGPYRSRRLRRTPEAE